MKKIATKIVEAFIDDLCNRSGLQNEWEQISSRDQKLIKAEWVNLVMEKIGEEAKEVLIEVGGDHGDGNVEVIKKPLGVKVIIKDFDNATLPEGVEDEDINDDNVELVPEVREYEETKEIG
jgi:hypothetical protein